MIFDNESEEIIKTAIHLIVSETRANPLNDCLTYPNNLMFVIRNIRTSHGLVIEERTLRNMVEPTVRLAWLEFGAHKEMYDADKQWFAFLKRKMTW